MPARRQRAAGADVRSASARALQHRAGCRTGSRHARCRVSRRRPASTWAQLERTSDDKGECVRASRTVTAGPAGARRCCRRSSRGAQGAADPATDALGRPRLRVRAAGALAGDPARRRRRRRRSARPAQPAAQSAAIASMHPQAGARRRCRRLARRDARARKCWPIRHERRERMRARGRAGRRRPPVACRGWTTHCSDEIANLAEWPVAIACTLRARVPRGAAGSAGRRRWRRTRSSCRCSTPHGTA